MVRAYELGGESVAFVFDHPVTPSGLPDEAFELHLGGESWITPLEGTVSQPNAYTIVMIYDETIHGLGYRILTTPTQIVTGSPPFTVPVYGTVEG